MQKNFLGALDSDLKTGMVRVTASVSQCEHIHFIYIFVAAAIGSSLFSPKQPHTLIQKGRWPFRVHAREASSITSV